MQKINADDDWKRYKIYAKYIKNFDIGSLDFCEDETSVAIREIAYSRSQRCLLPNLSSLKISDKPLSSVLFINDDLQDLSISLDDEDDLPIFLHYILPKATRLAHLKINCSNTFSLQNIQEEFVQAFQFLTNLKCLRIDKFNLSPRIFKAITTLPALKVFDYRSDPLSLLPVKSPRRSETIADGAPFSFTTLEEMSFRSSTEIFHGFFDLQLHNPCMKTMVIEIRNFITAPALRCFSQSLALRWEQLSELKVILARPLETRTILLKYEALRSLCALHQLHKFIFHYPGPIVMEDDDVETLVKNWSKLTHFELKTEPNGTYPPDTTLSSLKCFATYCQDLEHLSIKVDGRRQLRLPQCTIIMAKLKHLAFGPSPVKKADVVALYLSQFCTSSCKLDFGDKIDSLDSVKEVYMNIWGKVSRNLNLILKALDRERKRNSESNAA